MAIRVLDRVVNGLSINAGPCLTGERSLGGTNEAVAEGLAAWVKRCPHLSGYFRILFDRYGLDAGPICEQAVEMHREKHSPDGGVEDDLIRPEVEYVCRHEMACCVEDLLDRRAGFLDWNPEKRLERLRYGAAIIRAELGLSGEEFEAQFVSYRAHLARFHTLQGSYRSTLAR